MNLDKIIKDKIRQNGSISVAEYMDLSLAHPQFGYYMRKDPFGSKGDFITAPEISQIFGELLGAWLADTWLQIGSPSPCLLRELGPGRGTLMADILRSTAKVTGFHDALQIIMVETSPILREKQQETLKNLHSNIKWSTDLNKLPVLPLLLVANEFFDALPIRQFIRTETGLCERIISLDPQNPERFCFALQQMGIRLVKGGAYSEDKEIVETCPIARIIMGQIASHIKKYSGAGIVIDYGYTGGSHGNTLQAVKNHGFHPVLENAGEADITAHVDFDALREILQENQVAHYDVIPQGVFLSRIGAEIRARNLIQAAATSQQAAEILNAINRLVSPMEMGTLFKTLAFCSDARIVLAGID